MVRIEAYQPSRGGDTEADTDTGENPPMNWRSTVAIGGAWAAWPRAAWRLQMWPCSRLDIAGRRADEGDKSSRCVEIHRLA